MFRLAVATASVTFLLILLGGIVWSTGSALACPDWPLCYGHFFPKMEGGVLYEHGHRLTVLVVATLSVAMLVLALRGRSLQQLALTEIGLVVVQAIFGGLTVLLRLPLLVRVVHLGLSQLVFASTLLLAVRAFQLSKPGEPAPMASVSPSARRALALGAAFVYVQLLLGALVRHTGSGMACTTAFLCDGSAWPSFGRGDVQMLHRYFALVTAGVVIWATVRAMPELKKAESGLPRALAIAAHVLILLQISLGIGTVQSTLAVPVATMHLGTGALLWGDLVLLWAFTGRPKRATQATPEVAFAAQVSQS